MLERTTDTATPAPRWSEWTPERQSLVDIFDRLGDLVAAVVAANGGKAPSIPRHPRPVTAADKVRERRRAEKHRALVAAVLPQPTAEQEGGD